MYTRVVLNEDEMPSQWYNLAADLPTPMQPPLGPDGKPITPEMLAPVFPMNLIEQEVSQERWIDIPEEVLDILYRWRPSPLHRAVHLEKALGTPAKNLLQERKRVARRQPQAQYRRCPGLVQQAVRHQEAHHRDRRRPVGQRACLCLRAVGLECKVFMVRISFDQKPFRKMMMQTWGANASPAPARRPRPAATSWRSTRTRRAASASPSARRSRRRSPTDRQDAYSLGSVLNHVLLHQTIIGLEAKKQLARSAKRKWTSSSAAPAAAATSPASRSRLSPTRSTARRSRSSRSSRPPARR